MRHYQDLIKRELFVMLRRTFFCASFMLSTLHAMELKLPENEAEIYKKMLSNCISGVVGQHDTDWSNLNDQATKYWRDPTPVLTQTVERQIEKLYPLLINTFLNNEEAAKRIMADYFSTQCENLYDHYLDTKDSTYSYFRSFPTQYSATVAYESKAIEMGIRLHENYHQLYAIGNQRENKRVEIIEQMNQQLEEIEKENEREKQKKNEMVRAKGRPAPSIIQGPKKPIRTLPRNQNSNTDLKTPSKPKTSGYPIHSPPTNLLEEIRNRSMKLRHVAPESFNRHKDPESLQEILKSRLKKIHKATHGAASSPSDDYEENAWQ